MQKGQTLIFVLIGILIIVGIAGGAFLLGRQTTPQPTPTPLSSTTTTSRHEDPWQNYVSGQNIDGISINYPSGWKVNYRKEYNLGSDYKAKYRLAFDFAPPNWKERGIGWMGWGILDFDVYDHQASIDDWVGKYSPYHKSKLTIKEDVKIGGRPTFEISTDISQFGATIIFGNDYTYDLSHSQDGSDDFVKDVRARSGIFSYIRIN